ncbi:hypothetical protein PPYR_08534, partial [Photinus pyralis]
MLDYTLARLSLFTIGLFTLGTGTTSDLLSKFHQQEYEIKKERFVLTAFNKTLINYFSVNTFKYNRTAFATNGTISLKFDCVGDDVTVIVQAHLFLSNQYRVFPLRFQISLCDCFEKRIMGLGDYPFGNLNVCPLKK